MTLLQWTDRQALLRSAPFFALIVIAAAISYRYHLLLLAQRNLIEHTYQVMTTLETTLVRTIDAETGQRGFVITGDERYLDPYRRAVDDLPALVGLLRRLVGDSPAQRTRVDELERRLSAKLAELQETMLVRQRSGLKAASTVVMRDRGRVEMDALRGVIGDMQRTEADLLAKRSVEARRTEHWLLAVTMACALLSVVARLGLALGTRRHRGLSSDPDQTAASVD